MKKIDISEYKPGILVVSFLLKNSVMMIIYYYHDDVVRYEYFFTGDKDNPKPYQVFVETDYENQLKDIF